MFIGTFDRETKLLLDKEFNFIHSRVVGKKIMWIYAFDKTKYMKFNKKEKTFLTKKLFF